MNEQQALAKMYSPGMKRPGKREPGGVIQIHVTRACDKACFNCTQGSQLRGPYTFMSPDQFRTACLSLKDYFGTVGMFGGNPAVHPQFADLCEIMCEIIPYERRGLWCNNPINVEKAGVMRKTFNPRVSNLNVHLDRRAYQMFKQGWPESLPFGLDQDSRHSPPFVALKDVLKKPCGSCEEGYFQETPGGRHQECQICNGTGEVYDEERAWELISDCDINKHWSAMICVFRGELRGFFCEIAGAQAMLHQDEPDYPDTGVDVTREYVGFNEQGEPIATHYKWWQLDMGQFADQVRKHCHECGVPLRGHGELACASDSEGIEQVSKTHEFVYSPKRLGREVQLVTLQSELGEPLGKMTDYLGNAK